MKTVLTIQVEVEHEKPIDLTDFATYVGVLTHWPEHQVKGRERDPWGIKDFSIFQLDPTILSIQEMKSQKLLIDILGQEREFDYEMADLVLEDKKEQCICFWIVDQVVFEVEIEESYEVDGWMIPYLHIRTRQGGYLSAIELMDPALDDSRIVDVSEDWNELVLEQGGALPWHADVDSSNPGGV